MHALATRTDLVYHSDMATIKPMRISDYAELVQLWVSCEGMGLHLDDSDSRDGIKQYLRRNRGLCFVARDGRLLVGAIMCGHDGRRGYLTHMAVAESHRRQGLGTELVNRSMAGLKRAGIPKCNLFVLANNQLGQAFWRRLGWQDYAEIGVKAMSRSVESKS